MCADLRFSRPPPPLAALVPVEIRQLLINPVSYASHAMSETQTGQRRIVIQTSNSGGMFHQHVRDHGHRIPPQPIDRSFEPFRAICSMGLGMGLAICRRIAEARGGTLKAANDEAGGAVVTLSLPLRAGSPTLAKRRCNVIFFQWNWIRFSAPSNATPATRSVRLKFVCSNLPFAGISNPRNSMSPIHRFFKGISTCATLALIAGCASTDSFAKLDTNGDGNGSRAEFDSYMKQEVFNRVDTNSDGKVVLGEWRAFNPKVDQTRFGKADTNRDGFITRTEADATFDREGSLKDLFTKIDTDDNGSLSRNEVKTFRAQVRDHPGTTRVMKTSNPSRP